MKGQFRYEVSFTNPEIGGKLLTNDYDIARTILSNLCQIALDQVADAVISDTQQNKVVLRASDFPAFYQANREGSPQYLAYNDMLKTLGNGDTETSIWFTKANNEQIPLHFMIPRGGKQIKIEKGAVIDTKTFEGTSYVKVRFFVASENGETHDL